MDLQAVPRPWQPLRGPPLDGWVRSPCGEFWFVTEGDPLCNVLPKLVALGMCSSVPIPNAPVSESEHR